MFDKELLKKLRRMRELNAVMNMLSDREDFDDEVAKEYRSVRDSIMVPVGAFISLLCDTGMIQVEIKAEAAEGLGTKYKSIGLECSEVYENGALVLLATQWVMGIPTDAYRKEMKHPQAEKKTIEPVSDDDFRLET